MITTAETLVRLLDYIEEVVKLDERVAFRLSDYRLADGGVLAVWHRDVDGLPGVALDGRDDDDAVWLSVERLARREPPAPPADLAPWIIASTDPGAAPSIAAERLRTVTAAERNALLAADAARAADFAPSPPTSDVPEAWVRFDHREHLADHPAVAAAIEAWLEDSWRPWAAEEGPRRRTIALYGKLYKLQQQLELGGADGGVEAVWGIGLVRWAVGGRLIERPLIERAVEIELAESGALRVTPTQAPARFDLKPYEEVGCDKLGLLDDAIRRELARVAADDGVVPFRRETFEAILLAAAARIAPDGHYRPGASVPADAQGDGPVITDEWVVFARPRARHVVLDDIARLREVAQAGERPLEGLAVRLVTPPSALPDDVFAPLDPSIGTLDDAGQPPEPAAFGDVFFPKPFNDEQVAIVRRLAHAEGLVVQGPPGTGKTHTIANLICHGLALGQRILVVSRGEAALAVLRDQLPEKIRPLAISILSSERHGLRQVEGAVRQIQAVVEESRPDIRRSAIRRCEAEILKIRDRIAAIDLESEAAAQGHVAPIGPRAEAPGDLARRLAAEDGRYDWFTDRPARFVHEAGIAEADLDALAEARRTLRGYFDVVDTVLPAPGDLPGADEVAAWHDTLRVSGATGPAPSTLDLTGAQLNEAGLCVRALRDLAAAWDAVRDPGLLAALRDAALGVEATWPGVLKDLCRAWREYEAERVALAPFAVEMHAGIVDDASACAAVTRGVQGERLWPLLGRRLGDAKEIVAEVRVRGARPGNDPEAWAAVERQIALARTQRAIEARWRTFSAAIGTVAPGPEDDRLAAAARCLALSADVDARLAVLGPAVPAEALAEVLAGNAARARELAGSIEAAASAARAAMARSAAARAAAAFAGRDRLSVMARSVLRELVGRGDIAPEQVRTVWASLLARLVGVLAEAPAVATLRRSCDGIAAAGAPDWAWRLRAEPPGLDEDPLIPDDWRAAWDAGAARAALARVDARETLLALARERDAAERRGRKLFTELVRERAFHALERRLSPRAKSALVEYVRAIGRLGRGTGKGAGQHRRAARDAMGRCYDAIPCWIMPSWRVAEQLPADLAAFDLVILDEASQSDVTELPALLRGKKILAVGDDRQVSPTPPFVSQGKIDQLRHHFLRHLPYAALLEPGESLYDLLRAVFPDSRLMLKEHFRCVEPIIRFSMGFYPEKLVPLRVPSAAERLDPPLVDIFVPHGTREGGRKINRAEAGVIVDEIALLVADPATAGRTVGVISLIGAEQAELVRVMLAERIGAAAMQRHAILCGDSATFQGNERDIVFLSMVADCHRRSTLTMARYEQRFNVAASRARDRLVLVRSVELDDLHSRDLKHRLIAHFADPSARRPAADGRPLEGCESDFERDVMGRLLALGYRVEPQVGSEGFRIDLVVEGADGRRLAVECDGDAFHGPERWRDDMRRQRILERVGWRFWRCFASSFYLDPEGIMADLVAALRQDGIEPAGPDGATGVPSSLVEHRTATAPAPIPDGGGSAAGSPGAEQTRVGREPIAVGDRVALLFADRKRLTLRLTAEADDVAHGLLSVGTPLGRAVAASEEGEEIDVPAADGSHTRVLVEAVEHAA